MSPYNTFITNNHLHNVRMAKHFYLVWLSVLVITMVMGVCVTSNATTTNIAGYYQEKSKKYFKFNELCISSNHSFHYHVDLFTSYCPSEECMNARIDEIHFDSPLKHNILRYKTNQCEITIHISQDRAIIKQKLNGCGTDQQLLSSDGNYILMRRNLNEDDCSPRGIKNQ